MDWNKKGERGGKGKERGRGQEEKSNRHNTESWN